MRAIELICALIVTIYVTQRFLRVPATDRPNLARRLALLTIASFVGEDSVMHAYDFYGYARGWDLFVDRTPLLIVLIWPVVIDSADRLARALLGARHPRTPLLASFFVLLDASLIEPIAVRANLWNWSHPGMFDVPPIGIVGWAYFAFGALSWFARVDRTTSRPHRDALVVVVAPLCTHLLLTGSWWTFFRWSEGTIPAWSLPFATWIVLAPLAAIAWKFGLRARISPIELVVRVPGALFFFALLAMHREGAAPLVVYALAFAPPYLALLRVRNFAPAGSPTSGLSGTLSG